MTEQIITLRELSNKLEIDKRTLGKYLCRFGQYEVENSWQYKYKYNYYFLTELKEFFSKLMYAYKGRYFNEYNKVVKNIDILLKEL